MQKIVPGQKAPIAGIAFGGDRGISKVEVSIDGGATWKSAVIKNPLSQYTWVLWTAGSTPKVMKITILLSGQLIRQVKSKLLNLTSHFQMEQQDTIK